MLEGGADILYIQQLLGHAKLETTAIHTIDPRLGIDFYREVERVIRQICAQPKHLRNYENRGVNVLMADGTVFWDADGKFIKRMG